MQLHIFRQFPELKQCSFNVFSPSVRSIRLYQGGRVFFFFFTAGCVAQTEVGLSAWKLAAFIRPSVKAAHSAVNCPLSLVEVSLN